VNLVERFAEAFNRRDVDGLLALFTEDATYADLFFGPHAGQAALRAMFERMFREGRDYRWQMNSIVTDAQRAAAEWTFSYTATAAVPRMSEPVISTVSGISSACAVCPCATCWFCACAEIALAMVTNDAVPMSTANLDAVGFI